MFGSGEIGKWLSTIAEHNKKLREIAERAAEREAKWEEKEEARLDRIAAAIAAGKSPTARDLTPTKLGEMGRGDRDYLEQERLWKIVGRNLETGIGNAIQYRLGQFHAIANRGFSGTVEGARMDFAMEQLSKQFAAVMSPILNGFTYAAVEIEKRFRGLNAQQQNGVMGGVLGAGIGARLGGLPGAAIGGLLGSRILGGGGLSDRDVAMGGLGAAALGWKVAGPYGAIPGTAAALHFGARDASDRYFADDPRAGMGDRLGRLTARIGIDSFMSAVLPGPGRMILDAAVPRSGGMVAGGMAAAGAGPARRDVTPFSADPLAAGGTADLIQKALIRATAGADFEDAGPLKPLIDIGLKIIDILLAILTGGTYAPPPESARR